MAGLPSVGTLRLGSQGLEVSALGLGCMGMSAFYGPPKPDQEMISLIRHAVSRGVTFLDTSDIYGPLTNEILVGKAIKGIREKVQLATKFGVTHDVKPEIRGDPAYVRAACEASLKRLEVDFIDLYYQHRIDTKVPIEVKLCAVAISLVYFSNDSGFQNGFQIGELKKLVEEGKIKYIGLSEASPSTIRRAHAVHPITAVQLEWSLWTRDVEDEIIPTCRELGIGIVPYSPLGGGFLSSGAKLVENLTNNDVRKTMPRLTVENLEKNKVTFAKIAEIASRKGCSPGQLSLGWIFHQGNDISPIPGTTKVENLEENIGSLSVKITPDEMKEIENILSTYSFSGNRLGKQHEQFTWINSETPPLSSWKDSI